jgi:hypothetical protein
MVEGIALNHHSTPRHREGTSFPGRRSGRGYSPESTRALRHGFIENRKKAGVKLACRTEQVDSGAALGQKQSGLDRR